MCRLDWWCLWPVMPCSRAVVSCWRWPRRCGGGVGETRCWGPEQGHWHRFLGRSVPPCVRMRRSARRYPEKLFWTGNLLGLMQWQGCRRWKAKGSDLDSEYKELPTIALQDWKHRDAIWERRPRLVARNTSGKTPRDRVCFQHRLPRAKYAYWQHWLWVSVGSSCGPSMWRTLSCRCRRRAQGTALCSSRRTVSGMTGTHSQADSTGHTSHTDATPRPAAETTRTSQHPGTTTARTAATRPAPTPSGPALDSPADIPGRGSTRPIRPNSRHCSNRPRRQNNDSQIRSGMPTIWLTRIGR